MGLTPVVRESLGRSRGPEPRLRSVGDWDWGWWQMWPGHADTSARVLPVPRGLAPSYLSPWPLPQRELSWARGTHTYPFQLPQPVPRASGGWHAWGFGSMGLALATPASTAACHFLQGQGLLFCIPSVPRVLSQHLPHGQASWDGSYHAPSDPANPDG